MKKTLLTLALLMAVMMSAFAQNKTITGTVTAVDEPLGLPGVSVYAKGTSIGTVTDIDGKYALQVPDTTNTVVFSFVGYTTAEVQIDNKSVVDVVLQLNLETLEEVVVIGYGEQQKKVATGSITKVGAERLDGYKVADVAGALDGQTSGLLVSAPSGQPGAASNVLIRGVSTNGNNNPLYVVDGLQMDGISNLNPEDIESIDVLKDAASAAIYGARAANGVVIVTTKKGSEGKGTITYDAFTSTSQPWKVPEMLGAADYIEITREKYANSNQLNALNGLGFPQVGDATPNTDWMGEIFSPATVQSHRLTATANRTYISMEYWDQEGVIGGGDKSNYTRYAIRLNSTKPINDYITLGENIYLNREERNTIAENNAFGTALADAFAYDPITDILDENGQYGFAQSSWVQKEYINPTSRLFITNNSGRTDNIQGNVYAEIKPIEGLRFRSDMGFNIAWSKGRSFLPQYSFHPSFNNPTNDTGQSYSTSQNFQFENYVNYKKDIGDHNFDVVLGTTYRTEAFEYAGGVSSLIPEEVQFDPNWQYIDAGVDSTKIAYGNANPKRAVLSYFGRVIYNYKGKYLFSASIRRDGSTQFGSNNRFGAFPSVSLGWVASDEDFFNIDAISFLKLRVSTGINGNDRIGSLGFASRVENAFTYTIGGAPIRGAALATPPNPNLKWEESSQTTFGIEARFFDDRLTTEIDFYQKTTKDLLMDEVIPGYIGATNNPTSNLGEIRNRGIEVAVSYRTQIGDLKLNTSLNYTHFKNDVTNVAGDAGFIQGWSWPVRNTPITRMTEGFPVGHFVGYQTLGIFQSQADVFSHVNSNGDLLQPNASPGDLIFADNNGDGVINSDDIGDIGSPWPNHIFGLTLNAKYKGFDFNVVFSTQIGQDVYRTYERSDVTFTNYQTFWKDRWTEANPSSELPRLTSTDPNNNQRPSDFYVEDASFLRLRNLQIGYNLPADLLKRVKLGGVRIYLSANNLFTVTGYRGFDPEIGTNGWVLDTGIDKGYYPSNRTIGAGLRISM